MKKTIIFSLLSIVYLTNYSAQAQITAKNAVFVELLGNGGIYSLNYDRVFYQKEKFKMSGRIGFAWGPAGSYQGKLSYNIITPVEWNFMFGKARKYFELGIGYTNILEFKIDENNSRYVQNSAIMIAPRIGYRYQKDEGGFFFRVGLTPWIEFPIRGSGQKPSYFPWLGVSLGKSF